MLFRLPNWCQTVDLSIDTYPVNPPRVRPHFSYLSIFCFSLREFDVYRLNTDNEVMYIWQTNCYAVYWYFMNIIFIFISDRELTLLYAIARPSVCLSSVTFVRATQAVQTFGHISTALGTWRSVHIHWKFYGDSPKGTLRRGGVKHKRDSKI